MCDTIDAVLAFGEVYGGDALWECVARPFEEYSKKFSYLGEDAMSKHQRHDDARIGRRTFLKGMLATAGLAACGTEAAAVYDPETAPRKMRGYYSLAESPFFKLENGRLINTVKNFPPAIDFHGHLGFWVGWNKDNLSERGTSMKYLMDCDNTEDCHLDLDVYLNYMASEQMLKEIETTLISGPVTQKGPIRSHTPLNYFQELDEMKFDKAVLLPLKMGRSVKEMIGLDLGDEDDMEKRWLRSLDDTQQHDRFEVYTSVNVDEEGWLDGLEAAAARGAKGIKVHPVMQRIAPNSDEAMDLFNHCARLKLDVFFHAGRAGIEPPEMAPFAQMENYIAPLEEFKDIQFIFGHAGARDWGEAFAIAKEYPNVWMELAGPSIPALEQMVEEFDNDRIIFGSDWPFYPIAASLIKVLHVAHGDDGLRDAILSDNARRLLRLS